MSRMTTRPASTSRESGDPRIGLFEAGLWLSVLCAVAAALLIDLVGRHVAVRMTFLIAITVLVAVGCARSERAYTVLREYQWLAPGVGIIPAVAVLGGHSP